MGLLDNLERGLEKAVRSAFSAGGSRTVKPVEIASALRHAMDDESFALSEGHTVAPNDFVVHFSTADFERARVWGSPLASELCDEAIRHADSQGYGLPGAVRVAFHADDALRPGQLRVDATLDDGSAQRPAPQAAPPAAAQPSAPAPAPVAPRRAAPSSPAYQPEPTPRPAARPAPRPPLSDDQATVVVPRRAPAPALPALEINGVLHRLEAQDLVLGRSPERADLVVPDTSVSREHARLVRVGTTVTLIDLGSRNGVLVNGRRIDGSTTLREGDRITVGQTDLAFHAAPQTGGSRA